MWTNGKTYIGIHTIYICEIMARQISVSNEVYMALEMKKGNKSFSEVIKEALTKASGRIETLESRAASKRLLARMREGYNMGNVLYKSREELHER